MSREANRFLKIASADLRERHVFLRDLELNALIGVHTHERGTSQPIRINIDLTVSEGTGPVGDELSTVVDYEKVANQVVAIVNAGHVNLVETLAERIAMAALEDARVKIARVRIEKLKAIPSAASVGVEIERSRSQE